MSDVLTDSFIREKRLELIEEIKKAVKYYEDNNKIMALIPYDLIGICINVDDCDV